MVSSGYLELGMLDEAACTLDEIDPADKRRREVLHAQLELAIAGEQWNSTVATAASLVRSHPEDPAGWLVLARAITKTANAEYAEAVLTKACKWHPEIAAHPRCCAGSNRSWLSEGGKNLAEMRHPSGSKRA